MCFSAVGLNKGALIEANKQVFVLESPFNSFISTADLKHKSRKVPSAHHHYVIYRCTDIYTFRSESEETCCCLIHFLHTRKWKTDVELLQSTSLMPVM